jgi:alkylhydroperoxidase family enzyme
MSRVIHKFTRRVPEWKPRVKPVELNSATPEQLNALKVTPSNTKVSSYVLTLAHDVESLTVRSPLFNAVNRCIYCAAVHADRHAQLEKSTEVTDQLFAQGVNADLSVRDAAIFAFAYKLSKAPPEAGPEDIAALRDAGLSNEEILDLILSSSLFGWANRLMHVLGDPVRPEEAV